MNRKLTFLLPLFVLGFLFSAKAQCPTNIDFELGTTANWLYYRGSVSSGPVFTVSSCAAIPTLHTLTTMPATDYYGGFPTVSPGGGLHSLRLGKDSGNYSTMRAAYNVHVPTTPGIYSLVYRYAAVLENPPSGHTILTEPRFVVTAFDSTTGTVVPCTTYNYVGDGSQPGFLLSGLASLYSGQTDVYYKTWTLGNMKFPGLGGHVITVQFTASGCSQSGHFGYGYLDMSCGFFANSLITCASGSTTLTGPDGFAGYTWWDSSSFTTSYGASQSVVIASPTITTTYAVVLTPYTGYGCPDTLYTRVVPSQLVTNRTHDTTLCSGTPCTLSMNATSPYTPITYSWGPTATLSCSTCASPVATPTSSTNYYCTSTDASGCQRTDTIHVTVVSVPTAITGPLSVCLGQTVTLSDGIPGGVWTSTAPGIASIGSTTGIVTGVSVGTTAVITYTLGGSCRVSRGITVNPNPSIITGVASMCVGSSTTLFDSVSGGTWSTSSGIINVGSSTGVVTGMSGGIANVTYTLGSTGCYSVKAVTVNTAPPGIIGTANLCVGASELLFDGLTGGTWSCSPTANGTINAVTGSVVGIAAGPLTVTYTLPTGCFTTFPMTINPIPGPISGPNHVCIGDTITLTDGTSGAEWGSPSTDVAVPYTTTGMVVGEGAGVAVISYAYPASGCAATYSVTVNPFPSAIGGVPSVCVGSTTILFDSDPGTWSISPTTIATIGSTTGIVTGVAVGTAHTTFTGTTGCRATVDVAVNPLPAPITGPTSLCVGTTVTLADATIGGSFSTSLVGAHATVSPGGLVTGTSVGTQVITYTSSLGCYSTYTVTVNTTPPPISGILSVCQGMTTVLSDAITGGVWTITPTTTATILAGVTTATVTGVAPGTATVTYALGAGCSTSAVVTVNPAPGAITPSSPAVCVGNNITLACPTSPGGTWSPVTGTNANIGAISGTVTGISSGLQVFTYTSATGCIRTTTVNVNPLPLPIAGPTSVCSGSTITLTDPSGGGSWTSLNPTIASITTPGGVVTGVTTTGGSATIKYTLGTGCAVATAVSVNPLPGLFTVTGGGSLCAGAAGVNVNLTGSAIGVSYQLKNGGTPVGSPLAGTGSALNFGPQTAAGTYTVEATSAATGCKRTMTGSATVVVNPVPTITGPSALCVGTTITLVPSIPGGSWVSSCPTCASIGASTGIVTGLLTGTSANMTYTLPTGCATTVTVNVSPSPGPITGAPAGCVQDSVLLGDSVPGGVWSSSTPIVATVGSLSGYVVGVSSGSTTITYSLGTGCQVYKTIAINPQPAAVTGTTTICQGFTATLHDATPGGTWSVAPVSSSLASVVSTTGVVTATITGGTTTTTAAIVYTLGTTGCSNWGYVTINPIPAPITGSFQVCQGSTTPLSDATAGGTWSISSTAYATINSSTGVLTGLTAGSPSTVSYTVAGCAATAPVTVNALPSPITGTTRVCQGQTTTLGSTPAGGTWTAAPSSMLTVSSGGVVTGATTGSGVGSVTYTLSTGCLRSTPVTLNVTPLPIVGPASVCVGLGASMADATPGGSWSSSNTSIASIGAGTGIITTGPTLTGPVTISYTLGTCSANTTFTVLNPPAPIGGTLSVCKGDSTTLTDITPGGSWASGTPSLATISSTGVVHGIDAGTVIISYGSFGTGGCYRIAPIVVNPISDIVGDSVVCVGQTIVLTDGTLGGTWSSMTPSICSIASTGVVTGVSAGTTGLIKYLIPTTGCKAFRTITVNPLPAPITGPASVCVGQSVVLATTSTGGTWSSSDVSKATVGVGGDVTGIAGGSVTITYTLSATGCIATFPMTVNDLPAAITGPSNICIGSTATFTDVTGPGTWMSTAPSIASVGLTSGVVSALALGSTDIVFSLTSTGCTVAKTVNVINTPSAPFATGTPEVCQYSSLNLFDTSGTGTWSSSAPSIAYVDPSLGVVTGVAPGNATITYSTGVGCNSTIVVTVDQTPNAPTGSTNLCVGQVAHFSSFPVGGTWSSSSPAFATVTTTTGDVTAVAAGSSTITYTLSTGCYSDVTVFVNNSPAPITGINSVCIGMTTTLSDTDPGGVWSSSSSHATVAGGVVTGVSAGVTTISYTIPFTTCPAMMDVTVNPVPGPITGTMTVCVGQTTTLSDAVPGSGWTSSNTLVATVDAGGVVTGVSAGTADITYTLGADCAVWATVTVNPLPSAIIGADSVCQGQFIYFVDPTPSGTWSSTNVAVGDINPTTGVMAGVASGTTNISYTVNGCSVNHPVTVSVQPTAILGNPVVCLGSTSVLSDAVPGGVWTSSVPAVAPVSTSGVVFGSALGSSVITYRIFPGGCSISNTVNVVPLPVAFNVTGGGSYCAGGSGVVVGLSGSVIGVNYMLYRGSTATGSFAGTGAPLSFGLQTVAGTYTVIATTTATGCTKLMNGSVVISVTPTVTPSVTINSLPNDTVCAGTSVSYTPVAVNGGLTPSYQWSVNGVSVATAPSYTFVPANGDIVTVRMTSSAVCPSPATATGSVTMTVQDFTRPSVSITATPGDTVCQGSLVTVNSTEIYGGSAPIYTWMKNGVIFGSGPAITYAPVNNDQLYCIMQSNHPCRLANSDSSSLIVFKTVEPVEPIVTIAVTPTTNVSVGQSATLTASVVNGGTAPTYQWYMNSLPMTGATNAAYTHTFTTSENDSFSCQVTSSGICRITGHQWVFMNISPVGVGSVNNAAGDINVVPNPNKGEFMIKGSLGSTADQDVSFEITNVIGQVVFKNTVSAKGGKLNERIVIGNNLANGMYMITLHSALGTKVLHMVVEQ